MSSHSSMTWMRKPARLTQRYLTGTPCWRGFSPPTRSMHRGDIALSERQRQPASGNNGVAALGGLFDLKWSF